MVKMLKVLILFFALAAVVGAALYFYAKAGGGSYYSQLQGEWTEVGRSSAESFTIQKNHCLFSRGDRQEESSFTVLQGENYNLNLEDAMTVSFENGDGPMYCDEYVYHTQQVDGHTVRILDSFMYEDDGRGLIVYCELVHNDDLQYVGEDFLSDLYAGLTRSEAVPDYMPVE